MNQFNFGNQNEFHEYSKSLEKNLFFGEFNNDNIIGSFLDNQAYCQDAWMMELTRSETEKPSELIESKIEFKFLNRSTAYGKSTDSSSLSEAEKSSDCASTHSEKSNICVNNSLEQELTKIARAVEASNDLNKLIDELIFTEVTEIKFSPPCTQISNKGKRMWKRNESKNTLEAKYRENPDWACEEFRVALGASIGYSQQQVYKWWSYRLTKDGLKVSNFSRKERF